MQGRLLALPGALVIPFLPPPIQGQGSTGGLTFEILDRSARADFTELARAHEALVAEAMKSGRVGALFSTFSVDDPQLSVTIDRQKAESVGVPLDQIGDALGVYLGSAYVNDFDFANRSYRVYAQAAPEFRSGPGDIGQLYVRSRAGGLTALDSLVTVGMQTAPPVISHYNLYRSIELNGVPPPGVSSGQAIEAVRQAADKTLTGDLGYDWSGQSWEEVRGGRQALVIFGLGLAVVFLVLSAQYESFALPLLIILAVPLALLGGLTAQMLRGLANDVFCQIGLLMLIGLASKNAILIVEFAEQIRRRGETAHDAVIDASMLRLRPILMTSFAFLLGILPLVFATGSGANGRHSMGTVLFGGILLSTVLNLFFTPALYLIMRTALRRRAVEMHA
jgi:hydrophobic/amphiphilic exporter-1 (mainly G- bacteria), HAE1 family